MPTAWRFALLGAAAAALWGVLRVLRQRRTTSVMRIRTDHIALAEPTRWRADWLDVERVERSAGELRLILRDGLRSPNLAPFVKDPALLAELLEGCLRASRRAAAMQRYAAQTGKVPEAEQP